MHEMAIVNNLLNECEKIKNSHNATKITKVKVSIGRLSGVEEHYFKEAFKAFASDKDSSYYNAELVVESKDLVLKCLECDNTFTQSDNEFKCIHCDSLMLKVISGEELILEQVELE